MLLVVEKGEEYVYNTSMVAISIIIINKNQSEKEGIWSQ
jgi:hypothetical protein